MARKPTLYRSHSAFLNCCHGFSFPTKVHHREDLRYFYFAFPHHKSLWVLDGVSLSCHLQTIPPVIPGKPPALWVYTANFRLKHGMVLCFESNSMQEARLYCYLLCSKTLKGMRERNLCVLGTLLFSIKQHQAHQEKPMWAWKDLDALWPGVSPVGFGFHLQT